MTALDGKTVRYADDDRWSGTVLGDSALAGWVNVRWVRPESFIGSHRPENLTVIEAATTGSDPAVEAADRAAVVCGSMAFRAMTEAAREALKPVQELHRPVELEEWHTCEGSHYCKTCRDYDRPTDWPCATAKLIYPSEDLKR